MAASKTIMTADKKDVLVLSLSHTHSLPVYKHIFRNYCYRLAGVLHLRVMRVLGNALKLLM